MDEVSCPGAELQISMLQKALKLSNDPRQEGAGEHATVLHALSAEKVPAESRLLQAPSSSTSLQIRDFALIFLALLCLAILALLTQQIGKLNAPLPSGGSEASAGKLLDKGQTTSSGYFRHATGLEQAESQRPPVICSSLILPNTEARFMVSLHSIRTANVLEIKGTSGRKLLTGTFGTSDHRKQFMLACVGCENDPRCIINDAGVERPRLEVLGRKFLPFGELEPVDPLMADGAVLKCDGKAVMLIEVLRRSDLQVKVKTPDNFLLATGGSGRLADSETRHADVDAALWQLQVKPGADAVLIISCILAMARHWQDLSCVIS